MIEVLIGTGGWAYFGTNADNLKKYSRYFRFVEVNSTFYSYPAESAVRRWRRQVPSEFKFSVKAHQDITHHLKFSPSEETTVRLEKMIRICETLSATMLVFQCPSSLVLDGTAQRQFRDLFSTVRLPCSVAVELRANETDQYLPSFLGVLHDLGFLQVVDLSLGMPQFPCDALYSRVFGHGPDNLYQFSDDEIIGLHSRVHSGTWSKAFLVFHTIGMYADAARMQNYEQHGHFLPVTHNLGVESVMEVLSGEVLPAWKRDLIERYGWRLCDWTGTRRLKLAQILDRIPERLYLTRTELRTALEEVDV